ncbi:MAG TPA: hypothetical protein VFP60_19640 [Pseudolabrys sp.]|nr:hypothetical protein [Pseudolabrys sp.]
MSATPRHPNSEIVGTIPVLIVALVDCLDQRGILSFEDYRDNLLRLYDQMGSEDASSGYGFVFERMLDTLNEAIARRN